MYLDRQMFLMMLKRMSILSTKDYRAAIFHLADGELVVTATNPELGESKEKIPLDYHRDPLELSYNPKFFLDSLNVIESDKVIINIVSENKPCLLKGENDNTYLCAIMPMRI
jgi:DNA polymerase-3 subunit beta